MELTHEFLAPGAESDRVDAAGLDERLAEIVARARARWPELGLDPARFARRLGECVAGAHDGPIAALASLHVEDLYLATACADGDPRALERFDAELLAGVAGYVARVDRAAAFVDEVRQRLREAMFLGRQGRPGIAAYSGRGALASWVHVAALRTALDLRRAEGDVRSGPDADALLADSQPELGYIGQRYREDFRAAFHEALRSLDADERRLLRLRFVDSLTVAQIGALARLDKSNVSRRLAQVRERLVTRTRRALRDRLRIDDAELDSLFGVVRSQLDVSLERLLVCTASD